jgi:hypothetical protein
MTANTPDHELTCLLDPVEFRPFFILGAHRSGTTLLYRMLQATELFNVLTLYHVVNYNEVLYNHINHKTAEARQALNDFFKNRGMHDRVIDGVQIDSDLPEEYGFILRNAAYDPCVNATSLPKFIELCKKVQFVSNPSRPLLLKNPRDFDRFPYLLEKFPDSKFIFIHRHALETINSRLKAIRAVFRCRSEYQATVNQSYARMFANPFRLYVSRLRLSGRLGLDLRRVRRDFAAGADYFLKNIGYLPPSAYRSVRYEDLCSKPESVIREIIDFLQMPAKPDVQYDAFIHKRPVVLLAEVARKRAGIMRSLKRYQEYCGYAQD